ncbi:3-ketoacyl-ACP reductase [Sporocytophaga myxococcoides]|uniref:3-ketoacyl-ACP reductase n=1 Tax=Sporocytophaga myxococcoides TaxID=153721 RepID=A0A098LJE0_9BACT|nr:SDR family oxidoreductase [Sporocytophaga myxococcoides]GAL87106.1 3-ketoacyl-ACP reductase [Sporocytophaga myxococcoides]
MNQKVLVTAGAAGIGLEILKAFAAIGAKTFVCDINETALKEVEQHVPGVITRVCDVSKRGDIESMVKFGAEAMSGLDVLVNNAGISGPTAPVEKINPDDWEKVMQVDLTGTFNVTRMAIPYLKKSSSGVIINMSSLAGRFGYKNRSPYSTAKWGIVGFTKTLSIELGKYGIRANAILPGAVAGPRIDNVLKGRAAANHTTIEEEKDNAISIQSLKGVYRS